MLLGFLSLTLIIFLLSAFILLSLVRINLINDTIIHTHVPLAETMDRMVDNIFEQERFGGRFIILKTPEMFAFFKEKGKEFDTLLDKAISLPKLQSGTLGQVAQIKTLHDFYYKTYEKHIRQTSVSLSPEAKAAEIKKKQEELVNLIREVAADARNAQNEKTKAAADLGSTAFRVVIIFCIIGIIASIGSTAIITRNIGGKISRLQLATREVAEGRYDKLPEIQSADELGDLSRAFREMAKRLQRTEEMYLDASPLTRLPGSIAIENVLKKRLESGNPLAFCLIDMDNFKAFNDRYGYAKGSEVIKTCGRIIEQCTTLQGHRDDFLGHIGGDDFVLISHPDRYATICACVIKNFDAIISTFYDKEDIEKGFIIGKTRQDQEARFPIMTVSIAVVTNTNRVLENPIQVGEIAAELKEYAKSLPGSVYVVDRRRKELEESDANVIRFPHQQRS